MAMIVTAVLAAAGGVLAFALISNDVLERVEDSAGHNIDHLDTDHHCGIDAPPLRPCERTGLEAEPEAATEPARAGGG
jgi:hypothetical protein